LAHLSTTALSKVGLVSIEFFSGQMGQGGFTAKFFKRKLTSLTLLYAVDISISPSPFRA